MANFSIEVTCETLTPMITSGVKITIFDLRPPLVKGLLRFWWRAFHTFNNTSQMRTGEGALFGDTARAAPFRLNVIVNSTDVCTKADLGLDSKEEGRSYFYFPLRTVYRPARKPRFTLSLRGIRTIDQAEDLMCALWLLENLGGIGSRSRRGAGSFRVTSVKTSDEVLNSLPFFPKPEVFESVAELSNWLRTSLEWIRARWNTAPSLFSRTHPSLPDYTRWSESARILLICDNQPDELVLMDKLAHDMRAFRDGNTKGNFNPKGDERPFVKEAKILHGRVDQTIKKEHLSSVENIPFTKASFGLPIQYRFGSRRKQPEPLRFDVLPSYKRYENGVDCVYALERRTSPLFLSFGKAAISGLTGNSESAYAIMTYLPAHFAGNEEKGENPLIAFTLALDEKPVERRIEKIEGETKEKAILRDRLEKAKSINIFSDGNFCTPFPGYLAVIEYLDRMKANTDLEVHQLYPCTS